MSKTIQFCGVSFWNADVEALTERVFATGGDVLVPAAPAFATILADTEYHTALREGSYVIFDSGLVAFLCLLRDRRRMSRISGLRLIEHLFLGGGRQAIERAHLLWIVPEEAEARRIENWIAGIALPQSRQSFYVAPRYRQPADFSDQALAARIAETRPDAIIVCIGGGTQEKLAWHLKKAVQPCPPILCTGAAVSFLTGSQARIPTWVDRACLGWLWRIVDEPKRFGPRYAATLWNLPRMLWQYYRRHGNWN
jgi:N-acetylglucosaminyldiphosphoundecaprenol N-acetyl-beta-D-mannosaminyltransferase